MIRAGTISSTNRRASPSARRSRRGAAAVETAIVAPVLLLFALAAIDFGRVVHYYSVVSNAARTGAEYGSMHGFTEFTRSSWETSVRAAVTDETRSLPAFAANEPLIDVATTVDTDGLTRVAVRVSCPFNTLVAWPGVPSETQLSHRVEMRRIQ